MIKQKKQGIILLGLVLSLAFILGLVFFVDDSKIYAGRAPELIKTNKLSKDDAAGLKQSMGETVAYFKVQPEIYTQYLRQKGDMGLVRVELQFKLKASDAPELLEQYQPALTSAFVNLIAKQPKGSLQSIQGREKLRKKSKKALRKTMKDLTGNGVIEEVLFTKYLAE